MFKKLLPFVAALLIAGSVHAQGVSKPQLTCSDTSGSATAQTCNTLINLSGTSGAPGINDVLLYNTTTANTGALTLAVNGGTAKAITKWLSTTALASGDMPANKAVQLIYDGTEWQIMTIGNAPSGATLPSGTQGNPLVNTTGSTTYATSALWIDCSQFTSGTYLASCLTAADTGNLLADARALGGNQAATAQMTIGDSSNTSGVVAQFASKALIQCQNVPNNSGAGACLFQFGGTLAKADGVGGGSNSIIGVIGTTAPTPAYMFSTNTGNAKFTKTVGLKFLNTNTNATKLSSGIDVFWDFVDDNSSMVDVSVNDSAGTAFMFEPFAVCCATYTLGLNLNANSVSTSTPMYIKGGSSHNEGLMLFASSIDHPGVGNPAVLYDDPQHLSTVSSFGEYGESNNATPNTIAYHSLSGVQAMNYFGLVENPIVASSTAAAITIDNTFASMVNVFGGTFENNSNMTFPAAFVVNNQTGHTANTDASGNVGIYTSAPAYVDAPLQVWGPITTGSGASSAGSTATGGLACTEAANTGWTPTAGQDYHRCDSTLHREVESANGLSEGPLNYTAGTYSVVAQTASVSATNIASSANFPAGGYMLDCEVIVTAVGTSPTLAVAIGWTDASGTARTKTCTTGIVAIGDNVLTQFITSNGSAAITITQTLAVSTATWTTTANVVRQ